MSDNLQPRSTERYTRAMLSKNAAHIRPVWALAFVHPYLQDIYIAIVKYWYEELGRTCLYQSSQSRPSKPIVIGRGGRGSAAAVRRRPDGQTVYVTQY